MDSSQEDSAAHVLKTTAPRSRAAIPKNRALRKDIRGSGVLDAAVRAERGKTLAQVSDLLLMLDTD